MNTGKIKQVLLICGLLGILLAAGGGFAYADTPASGDLFEDVYFSNNPDLNIDPTVIRSRFVRINFTMLPRSADGADAGMLDLNLFDDVFFRAVPDHVEINKRGRTCWTGHIQDVEHGQVVLIYKDGLMAGNISLPGAFYQIRYVDGEVHAIQRLDHAKFQSCANTGYPSEAHQHGDHAAETMPVLDSGSSIDVLVVYNQAARTGAGGTSAMETLIDLAVTETNTGYANSGITQRLNLVYTAEVDYIESGSIFTDRDRLRNQGDGYMDEVHVMRDAYAADLVMLITEGGGGYCGVAYIMTPVSSSFAGYAFCVVKRSCATGYYSFGHEFGHLMSARHDWYVDTTNNSPFTYNHGFINVEDQWRTVMAYNNECSDNSVNCTRLDYWSNPDVLYGGDAMGVPEGSANAADNRKTLNNTANTVANFRQHGTTPAAVVIAPNGGESMEAGTTYFISWGMYGTTSNARLEYSTDNGGSWNTIISSTANDGSYSWTVPNAPSTQCRIRVSDATDGSPSDTSDAVFSILEGSTYSITVTAPNGGESWQVGSTQAITWSSEGVDGNVALAYSTNNGGGWTSITSSTANDGSHMWSVPNAVSSQCLIRVSGTDLLGRSISDVSNAVFSIITASTPSVTVTAPNGGESWAVGSSQVIYWSAFGGVERINIEYSTNNGGSWTTITSSLLANLGAVGYSWTIPNKVSSQCLVRVKDSTDGNPSDTSDAVFSIVSASTATITVTSPNGGESLSPGGSHNITWSSTGTVGNVKIQYTTNNGGSWQTIAASTANDGSYTWSLPSVSSSQCKVKISEASDGSPSDTSNAVFSIAGPGLTVTSPNGGENLETGTSHAITWTSSGTVGNIKIEYSVNNGGSWSAIASSTANDGSYNWTVPDSESSQCKVKISEASDGSPADTSDAVFTIYTPTPPEISLNRTSFNYGAVIQGTTTGGQTLRIDNSGGGTLNWTAVSDASWLACSPASGSNAGTAAITVNAAGLAAGSYSGTITISDAQASNSPQTVTVNLTVKVSSADQPPFGEFSTPLDGSAVSSSIAVTGWVLDDVDVASVKIYNGTAYVGDAVFVEGARPDLEQAYPGYPKNYQAGWGYMLLTNFLPNGGNGTYTLYAKVVDSAGHQVTLGSKTITINNASATKPFGAIDIPAQGGEASGGNFTNAGWVLTPQPNKIPESGSTIGVYVDSVKKGTCNYNAYREDVATLFPGYANSDGASAWFKLDTTAYANGVHSIYWIATDNAGNADGIGSRFFVVQNTGGSRNASLGNSLPPRFLGKNRLSRLPLDSSSPVRIIKGFGGDTEFQTIYPGADGIAAVRIAELERVEIKLSDGCEVGYQVVGNQLRTLPVGSTLDVEKGIFYWIPGPGFVGQYQLVFVNVKQSVQQKINIRIEPGVKR